MCKWFKEFTHNCIVHPLMMFLPREWGDELHDRNADWAFGPERYDEIVIERALAHHLERDNE